MTLYSIDILTISHIDIQTKLRTILDDRFFIEYYGKSEGIQLTKF